VDVNNKNIETMSILRMLS